MNHWKNAKIAALLPALLVASACNELSLEPHASVSNDAYFASIGDFRAAIVGVYDQISIADYYGRSLHLMSDIMGEDVKQNGSANRYQEFADFAPMLKLATPSKSMAETYAEVSTASS